MLSAAKAQAELQIQRAKLTTSYNALLEEFSAQDLRTVGNYTLGQLIGKGSFGKVYLATHKLIRGSKVVLKSAKKDDMNLAREIHHHRQFLHPHIARLYEVIVTESLVWLVLEYCPGDELYNYLTHHGPIEPPVVQKIFTQLVGAVSYVHNQSCVHRDLKLENILLDKHGDVKLVDFGFTREYEGKSSYLQTWCGTVCYSAPEMLKGEKYAAEKVDVWSLGVILYALLCGELPFDEDGDAATKMKILKEEPKYPDSIPGPAKEMLVLLLAKRPLLRPSLAEILTSPWLAEHAPQQQAVLKLQQPAPFTTQLEKDTLEKMRSAGVDIDVVIENVLSQRCDALAGWWSLLLEKNERKEKRRQRRRKEKESEAKALRRLSAMSGRSLSVGTPLTLAIEESPLETISTPMSSDLSTGRGRDRTMANGPTASSPPLRQPQESHAAAKLDASPQLVVARRRRPSPSTARRRSLLGQGDSLKRSSTLQVLSASSALLSTDGIHKKRRRRYQQPFLDQLAAIKKWFKDNATRAKSPSSKQEPPITPNLAAINSHELQRVSTDTRPDRHFHSSLQPSLPAHPTDAHRSHLSPQPSSSSARQMASHSPSPLTPQSSYRRNSNLRGRKSTSSSVSSVQSYNHRPSLSKASSTSSNSAASPSTAHRRLSAGNRRNSPSRSLKVLPAPPGNLALPNDIRIVRSSAPPLLNVSEARNAFTGLGPPSPGLVFVKRKRTPFKGPTVGSGTGKRKGEGGSVPGARSREIIEEEDEDEEEYVEEVDHFSPVLGPGEYVVEDETFDGGPT